MKKMLISACLLGDPVGYDGKSKTMDCSSLEQLIEQGQVVRFCPEVAGGLPTPRPGAEIKAGDGDKVIAGLARVQTLDGTDVTAQFLSGASQALALCRQHDIRVAVLAESSPSCGSSKIYDGSFTRNSIPASGVTAALLRQHGIEVFNQHQLPAAISHLESSNSTTRT